MNSLKLLLTGYIVVLVCLFLYSFTQIDLSLTFSRIEFLRHLVSSFQYVGYFNRHLSGSLYLLLVMALYIFYFVFLFFASKKNLSKAFIWKIVIVAAVILTFSYNAFSHDLFNYIFDAKIVTHYQQNPYEHKALDFPGDPMLSFMHWTHRVYPYGPFWLALTVPLSFIGFNLFLPTLFLFKLLMGMGFLGSVYFIGKIFQKVAPEKERFGLVFFALNPLILIESLVSSHLDIVMMFFALWAFYLLISKKYLFAWVLFFISVGIKFATVFLLPVFLLVYVLQQKKKHISWHIVFVLSVVLLMSTVIVATLRTNMQPWYLVTAMSFAVFIAYRYFVFLPVVILSFVGLLAYAPYLFIGNWDKPVPQILSNLYISGVILSVVAVGGYYVYLLIRSAKVSLRSKVRKATA